MSLSPPELPSDVIAFLSEGRQLEYDTSACEPGQVKLVSVGSHATGEVWIHPDDHPLVSQDSHAGRRGYYAIPAVNLVAEAEGYEPEFILLWLPDSHAYGTWDCDHWTLWVFPGVNWTQIAASPLKYINAQWSPADVETEPFVPWPKYPFCEGRPF